MRGVLFDDGIQNVDRRGNGDIKPRAKPLKKNVPQRFLKKTRCAVTTRLERDDGGG